MLALLLLLVQANETPAVGDTVWIRRALTVPAGMSVRPRPLAASGVLEPLGPPEVTSSGREIQIRYPVVFWRPGTHRIDMPAVIVVRSDGFSDTLAGGTASIEVRSVLPPGAKPDSLKPAPPAEAVARSTPSPIPLTLLVVLAALVLIPLHWWWRKRGPTPPAIAGPVFAPPDPKDIAEWVEAGELHAAADAYARLLEPRAAKSADPALTVLLSRLGEARYGAVERDELLALCRDAARTAEA
jgi:hypothetical protein